MSAFSDINETMQFFNLKFVKDTVNGVEIVRYLCAHAVFNKRCTCRLLCNFF